MNDQTQQLLARITDLEAQLYAIGAGGVRQSINPPVQPDTSPAAWAIYSDDGTAIRLWSRDKKSAQEAADKLGLPLVALYTCTKTADLHKAPAPAQQEPVAWRVRPFDYGIGYEGVDALTTRKEQCEIWARKGWKVEPLYTAPQPTSQPLTDEKLYALYCEAMKGYYISSLHHWRDAEAHKFARAIEAAVANQPPRQPLTDSQVKELVKKQPAEDLCRWSYGMGIKDAEAAHGITGGQQ